jgi:hypothetical protein
MKWRTPQRSSLHVIVATALLGTSVPIARASEPATPTQSATDSRALAKERFTAGLASYEAEDFAGAIAAWTSARELMAGDAEARDGWHVLGLDLAQAHVRAYRIDRDRSHFAPAKQLLDAYVAWVDRPEHTMTDAEREDRPRALEMLAFLEREDGAIAPASAATPAPVVAPSPADADRPIARVDSRARKRKLRAAHAMIGTAAVSLGIGVGGVVAAVVGGRRASKAERDFEALHAEIGDDEPTPAQVAEREELVLAGKRANATVIAGSVAAALFLSTGAGLLAGGLVVRKHALRVTPAVGRGYAGAGLSMRF